MKKIRPLGDRVLVERDKSDEKTPGGLHIPEAAREQMCRGVVLEVGPGRVSESGKRIEPSVKKGDKVVFGRYAGQEAGQRYEPSSDRLLLREDDILGVVEED
jgi:chaperonin GroES